MKHRKTGGKQSFLVGVGSYFLFLLLMVLTSSGVVIALGYASRPRGLGCILFALGSILATLTVNAWARILPGIFGIATLNGIIIVSSGHALTDPSVRIPRLLGSLFTILMAGASLTTASFPERQFTMVDRIAYLGILSCFVAMATFVILSIEHWEGPTCIGLIACLVLLRVRSVPRAKTFVANGRREGM
jgi:hypothetical protein